MRPTGLFAVAAVALALACGNGPRVAEFEGGGSFVAEDAGQIPLTSPGTAPRSEREVIGIPVPPLEYVAPVPEERPFDEPLPERAGQQDTGARRPPTERQQRATDTLPRQQQAVPALPPVRVPQPQQPPRAGTAEPASPPRPPVPPPPSRDTGGAGDGAPGVPSPGTGSSSPGGSESGVQDPAGGTENGASGES